MPDPVVHFEIPGDDLETLATFYSRLFDWKIEKFEGDMEYYMVSTGPADENGMPARPGTIFGGLAPRMAGKPMCVGRYTEQVARDKLLLVTLVALRHPRPPNRHPREGGGPRPPRQPPGYVGARLRGHGSR